MGQDDMQVEISDLQLKMQNSEKYLGRESTGNNK